VAAWRARGRVPVGVDVTASLLETMGWDPAFDQQQQQQLPRPPAGLSEQQLRLQYSVVLVRLVNGITDSLQKGKMATSVSGLADAAGLSRLLVDIRHTATHNELPTLATLRLGARHALQWLGTQYWCATGVGARDWVF
jgi:ribosomal biogenesis protein LAS1